MQHTDDMADMENEISPISKTKKKKEAHALQKLGETLADLPIPHIKAMDLPEKLRQALIEGKSITANVAARRHRQYIGVLMRDADPQAIQMELDALDDATAAPAAPPATEPEALSQARVWTDRLLTFEPGPVEDLLETFPMLERQQIRQLLRNIGKEKKGGKPSKTEKALEALIQEQLDLAE